MLLKDLIDLLEGGKDKLAEALSYHFNIRKAGVETDEIWVFLAGLRSFN